MSGTRQQPRRAVRTTSVPNPARRAGGLLVSVLMFLSLIVAAVPPVGAPTQAFAGDVVTNSGNFSLQLTADPNPAYEGDTVTWTVTVKNLRTGGTRPILTWRPGTVGAWGARCGWLE